MDRVGDRLLWAAPNPALVVFGLATIPTSGAAIGTQIGAAIVFVIETLAIVEIVLLSNLFAPTKTEAITATATRLGTLLSPTDSGRHVDIRWARTGGPGHGLSDLSRSPGRGVRATFSRADRGVGRGRRGSRTPASPSPRSHSRTTHPALTVRRLGAFLGHNPAAAAMIGKGCLAGQGSKIGASRKACTALGFLARERDGQRRRRDPKKFEKTTVSDTMRPIGVLTLSRRPGLTATAEVRTSTSCR